MAPHDVPMAKDMIQEITKEKVGNNPTGNPPTIQRENNRSVPTSTMIRPTAHANVNSIIAGNIRPIPYRKLSTAMGNVSSGLASS